MRNFTYFFQSQGYGWGEHTTKGKKHIMQIDIACQNTTLTDAMREAVNQKFAKLDRQTDLPVRGRVVLGVEGHRQLVEANFHVDGAHHHAHGEAGDLYQAMDVAVDRLSRSMRKAKTHEIQGRRQTKQSLRTLGMAG